MLLTVKCLKIFICHNNPTPNWGISLNKQENESGKREREARGGGEEELLNGTRQWSLQLQLGHTPSLLINPPLDDTLPPRSIVVKFQRCCGSGDMDGMQPTLIQCSKPHCPATCNSELRNTVCFTWLWAERWSDEDARSPHAVVASAVKSPHFGSSKESPHFAVLSIFLAQLV